MSESDSCEFICNIRNDLIQCRGTGVFTLASGIRMLECVHELEEQGYARLNRFYDFSGVTEIDANYSDIGLIAAYRRRSRAQLPGVLAGFWVSDPVVFGVVKTYEAFRVAEGANILVSFEKDKVAEFLQVPVEYLCA